MGPWTRTLRPGGQAGGIELVILILESRALLSWSGAGCKSICGATHAEQSEAGLRELEPRFRAQVP